MKKPLLSILLYLKNRQTSKSVVPVILQEKNIQDTVEGIKNLSKSFGIEITEASSPSILNDYLCSYDAEKPSVYQTFISLQKTLKKEVEKRNALTLQAPLPLVCVPCKKLTRFYNQNLIDTNGSRILFTKINKPKYALVCQSANTKNWPATTSELFTIAKIRFKLFRAGGNVSMLEKEFFDLSTRLPIFVAFIPTATLAYVLWLLGLAAFIDLLRSTIRLLLKSILRSLYVYKRHKLNLPNILAPFALLGINFYIIKGVSLYILKHYNITNNMHMFGLQAFKFVFIDPMMHIVPFLLAKFRKFLYPGANLNLEELRSTFTILRRYIPEYHNKRQVQRTVKTILVQYLNNLTTYGAESWLHFFEMLLAPTLVIGFSISAIAFSVLLLRLLKKLWNKKDLKSKQFSQTIIYSLAYFLIIVMSIIIVLASALDIGLMSQFIVPSKVFTGFVRRALEQMQRGWKPRPF